VTSVERQVEEGLLGIRAGTLTEDGGNLQQDRANRLLQLRLLNYAVYSDSVTVR
jgi:hypothetical protein